MRYSKIYNETPTAFGVTETGALLELYTGQIHGRSTWTLVLSRQDGCSVPVSAGYDWERKMQSLKIEQSAGAIEQWFSNAGGKPTSALLGF